MSRTAVYRMFDADGRLLYVGCSSNLSGRLASHVSRTPWFGDVVNVWVDHYDTRAGALIAEARAISHEAPIHNVQHAVRHLTPKPRGPLGRPKGHRLDASAFKSLLSERRLTQLDVCATTGLSPAFVSTLKSGRVGASTATAVGMAEALEVHPSSLFPTIAPKVAA